MYVLWWISLYIVLSILDPGFGILARFFSHGHRVCGNALWSRGLPSLFGLYGKKDSYRIGARTGWRIRLCTNTLLHIFVLGSFIWIILRERLKIVVLTSLLNTRRVGHHGNCAAESGKPDKMCDQVMLRVAPPPNPDWTPPFPSCGGWKGLEIIDGCVSLLMVKFSIPRYPKWSSQTYVHTHQNFLFVTHEGVSLLLPICFRMRRAVLNVCPAQVGPFSLNILNSGRYPPNPGMVAVVYNLPLFNS